MFAFAESYIQTLTTSTRTFFEGWDAAGNKTGPIVTQSYYPTTETYYQDPFWAWGEGAATPPCCDSCILSALTVQFYYWVGTRFGLFDGRDCTLMLRSLNRLLLRLLYIQITPSRVPSRPLLWTPTASHLLLLVCISLSVRSVRKTIVEWSVQRYTIPPLRSTPMKYQHGPLQQPTGCLTH